ncbi:MAG: hypothetical protein JSS56_24460 [Proteobacteria bacterium]|nr:hypothetical protein [Pseudomonadota bacterium]
MSANIPDDFPGASYESFVPGGQAKFIAELVDGKYVVGLTRRERGSRYRGCQDLVDQLVPLSQAEDKRHPDFSPDRHLRRLKNGILRKGWDLSAAETDWIVKRVGQVMGWVGARG